MKVIIVTKAQKPQGTCEKCKTEIKAGDSYRWFKPRFGAKHVRCMKSECTPKQSELTQSEFLSTLYRIEEDLSDAIAAFETSNDPSDYATALADFAQQLRDLGSECQEKYDNMPDGLRDGETGQLLQERAEGCERAADEMDQAASDAEQATMYDDVDDYISSTGAEKAEDETDEEFKARAEQEMEEANDDARDDIQTEFDLSIS